MNIREGLKRLYILGIVAIEIAWVVWPVLHGTWKPLDHRAQWAQACLVFCLILLAAIGFWFLAWLIARWIKDGFLISN